MFRVIGMVLAFLFRWLVAFPIVALNTGMEVISGEGRWIRCQQRRMSYERLPLTDIAFVEQLQLPEDKTAIAMAVRQSFAQHCGLPNTAIYPDDEIDILLRLMSPWAGELEIMFDVERALNLKIPCGKFDDFRRVLRAEQQKEQLGQFVSAVIATAVPYRRYIASGLLRPQTGSPPGVSESGNTGK